MICKLLLIGDSLIFGFGGRFDSSYNSGKVSDTTQGIINRMEIEASRCEGDVILHIGVNDIGYKNKNSIQATHENTRKSVEFFHKKGRKVYLLAIPSSCKWQENVSILNGLNSEIENSTFIDLPEGIHSHLTKDCVHLKKNGYDLWYDHIRKYLK